MGMHRSNTRTGVINFNTSGDNVVISAPVTGGINVYALTFTVNGSTNVTFKDSIAGSLSGAIVLTGNGSSMTLPMQEEPWYTIQPGGTFTMNSSNAVTFGGTVWYTLG
jgi:hypothetical protein